MSKKAKRILPFIFAVIMVLAASVCVSAATRETDADTPGSGNAIVLIPGEFEAANVSAVLDLINSYRKEACDKGYPDPRDPSRKLISTDYKPIKWSGDLEWIAQTRAAEGAVYQSHTRPNGKSCFTCVHNGVYSWNETLAWNYGSLTGGIGQWYGEKDDWVRQNSEAVTGHYTAMIDPSIVAVGIGCFTSKSGDWSCVAGEYSYDDDLSETPQTVSGACDQKMEVKSSNLSGAEISGNSSIVVGKSASYAVTQTVTYPHIWGGDVKTPVACLVSSWTSSDTSVATVNSSGTVSANKTGKTVITARLSNGSSVSKSVNVTQPGKGTVIIIKDARYKIIKAGSEAAFIGVTRDKSSVSVPAAITYYGKKYKVTQINANAFKGKKIRTVTISANVKKLCSKAFNGSKTATLIIRSKKLTKASVKGSLKGSSIKTIRVKVGSKKQNKAYVKKYKGFFTKKNAGKKPAVK